MSIEQKIAELLAESKAAQTVAEEVVSEEVAVEDLDEDTYSAEDEAADSLREESEQSSNEPAKRKNSTKFVRKIVGKGKSEFSGRGMMSIHHTKSPEELNKSVHKAVEAGKKNGTVDQHKVVKAKDGSDVHHILLSKDHGVYRHAIIHHSGARTMFTLNKSKDFEKNQVNESFLQDEEVVAEQTVLDIKEDVAALINGEDLSEEFKEKAATIFEAAVMNRVKQEVLKLDEANQVKLAEQIEEIKEGLVEKVDGYLDYVVEQWMEQNEIALESGMKSDILEGFVGGLKGLFEEHYIDIPEEKFDVVGNLEEEVSTLHTKLDEQVESNVSLKAELAKYQVSKVIASLSEGLADTDKEKFNALVEELEFDGIESFEKKAQTIRENYFTNKVTTTVVESVVTDAPVILAESQNIRPEMKGYLSVLDNLK